MRLGHRYHEGQEHVDAIERLAISRARRLFGYDHANVQVYSGSLANLAVLTAFLEPGDKLMALDFPSGGHLSHGMSFTLSGETYQVVRYGVRPCSETVDLDEVRRTALREQPKLMVCGGSSLPRVVDFKGFREISDEIGAVLLADVAHPAG